MTTAQATPRPLRVLRAAPLALSDIKVAHSVFALPFAVFAAFLAAAHADQGRIAWRRFAGQLALVVLCMVLARTWAMLVNRLADHRIDAANPRTAGRVVASGRLDPRTGWAVALLFAAAFIGATGVFWAAYANPWPLILSIPVLAWIALYSYTKRFTWLCHLFLGGALGVSPIAAAIAVDPASLTGSIGAAVVLLAGFVMLWVAGFDVAYALQDLDFDRRAGLHSIPARLGWRGALWTGRLLHLAAMVCLTGAVLAGRPLLGPLSLAAAAGVGALLIYEHLVLARRGLAGLPMAFFTINGAVSCGLGLAGVLDVAVL